MSGEVDIYLVPARYNILVPEINCFSNTFIFMISEKQTSLQFDQSH